MSDVTKQLRHTVAGQELYAAMAEYDSAGNLISGQFDTINSVIPSDASTLDKLVKESDLDAALNSAVQGVKLAGAQAPIPLDAGNIATIPTFSTNGPGLVPSATLADADKALRGDGTWGDVSSVSISYDSVNEELHLDFSAGGN